MKVHVLYSMYAHYMQLHIITPEGQTQYAGLQYVSLPTASGIISVRPSHIALATRLVAGEVFRTSEKEYEALESFADHTQKVAVTE